MSETVREMFNQSRMNRCLELGRSIINCRAGRTMKPFRIECEPWDDKPLAELRTMYFSFIVNNEKTDLPLIDTLVVLSLVKDQEQQLQQREQVGEFGLKTTVKTEFTEPEVRELLSLLREPR